MENDSVMKMLVPQLETSQHDEADTRMLFHAYYIATHTAQPVKILVRADDADVFINFLHHDKKLENVEIYQDLGLCSKNNRRIVNLSALAKELGSDVSMI